MFDVQQITNFLIKCVWVACGFAGGYLFAVIAGIGYDKLVAKKPSPPFLHKAARILGGAIAALIVAFFMFPGGPGTGAGGGGGSGPDANNPNTTGPTSPEPAKTPPTEKQPDAVTADAVFVTVYAGNAVERGTENYFALGGKGPKVDVKAVLDAAGKKGGVVIVYTFDATATEGTRGYSLLQQAAKEAKVGLLSAKEYEQIKSKK